MNIYKPKKAVIVLGAGRTGTSLLMNVLSELKMTVSALMTQPSEQNRLGGFEDSSIFSLQNELIQALNSNSKLPLPDDWLSAPIIQKYQNKLETVLMQNINDSQTVFGFKDPKTAILIPIWFKIFNKNKIVPMYVLSVRNPKDTVISLVKNYNYNHNLAELFWMHKNCAALLNTGSNCYIVHYEDWFSRPLEQANELLKFTGLDEHFSGNVDSALKNVIKPNLNRAIYEDYEVKNEYVLKLYNVLRDSRGDNFDRSRLMDVVKECRKAMDGFKGWYIEAQKTIGQLSQSRERLNKEQRKAEELANAVDKERRKIEELNDTVDKERRKAGELANLVEDERRKSEELAGLVDKERLKSEELAGLVDKERLKAEELASLVDNERRKAEELAVLVDNERQKSKKLSSVAKKKQQELVKVRSLTSFTVGNMLVKAIKNPGWRTVRLPKDLFKLFITALANRRKQKLNGRDCPSNSQGSESTKGSNCSEVSALVQERNRQRKLELEILLKKQLALTNDYEMTEARIAELEKKIECSNSETESYEITEAVLKANKILLELKSNEAAKSELRNRCQKEKIGLN